ncbi:hypothetical protein HRF87_27620 [Bacillus sp. CRN 9]|nr:hypothetical protein [Bacillus sp. CRN 9]
MRKFVYSLSLLLMAMFFVVSTAAANENVEEESDTLIVSDVFVKFVNEAYKEGNTIEVIDSEGNDISNQFVEDTYNLFLEGDYVSIYNLINDQNLSFAYEEEKIVENEGVSTFATTKTMATNKSFYKVAKSQHGISKDWSATIRSSMTYQVLPEKVVSLGKTTVSFDTTFGTLFSPYQSGVSTSGKNNGSSATFSASYTMKATQELAKGVPWRDHNFGSHSHSFTKAP